MSVVARTREVRLARWADGVGAERGALAERIAGMHADEILEHDNVSVLRCPSGWIVRLGDGGVSLASTPERAVHYVNDRLRLAEQSLADHLDRMLRDHDKGEDSPTYARVQQGKILVQFSARLGGFQALALDDARRYLAWLESGNSGGPYLMDAAQ